MIEFKLNDQYVSFDGDESLSLLKFLRSNKNLTSLKDGCSAQASCGACTVQIDKKAALACSTPLSKISGKSIYTIEGFSDKVQENLANAFSKSGAVQCGFCTPGFVVRTKVLLENNPSPTEQDILKTLQPHICRCTGYKKIIEAIQYLSKNQTLEKVENDQNNSSRLGSSYTKYESKELALGQRKFVNDISFPEMQFAALKYTKYPHAVIKSISLESAQSVPGVTKIFTAKDIPGMQFSGTIQQDWPLMVNIGNTTKFIGDVVACVVAISDEIARKAVELIEVQYEILKPVTTVNEALNQAVPFSDYKNNILETTTVKRDGDCLEILDNSAFTVSGVYETQRVEHAYMETESAIGRILSSGKIEIYSQSQGIYVDQKQIADILNLNKSKINVISVPTGGAFGGKEDLTVQGHVALATLLLKIPVKLTLSRDESMRMSTKRHPMQMEYRLGCTKEGKLTALYARIIGDSGAYASVGAEVLSRAASHATSAYHVPVVDIESKAIFTNNNPCGAMRGFGVNQVAFAMESSIDELCEIGGFDRWKFRYDNAVTNGSKTATGQILKDGIGLKATLEAVKDDFYAAKYAGIACGMKNVGIGNGVADYSKVKIVIKDIDRVILYQGWTEMGQGLQTIAVQLICEETGIEPSIIEVRAETGVPEAETGMTTASRGTSLLGNAIIAAAKQLKKDLQTKSLKDLIGKTYLGEWSFTQTTSHNLPDGEDVVSHYSYGYATQLVILNDDGEINTVVAAHDGGKVFNPTLFNGQVEGSLHMGLGYALTEDYLMEGGYPISTKLRDLQILRAKQTPKFVVKSVEVKDPLGPYGAKGVGEIGLVPTAPAVANAFYQYDGIRHKRLPMKRWSKRKNKS